MSVGAADRQLGGSAIRLSVLLDGLASVQVADDCEVFGVQLDSRLLAQGDVFIALQGDTVHGLDFLQNAVDANIAAVLVTADDKRCGSAERSLLQSSSIALIEVDSLLANAGIIAGRFFNHPSGSVGVVGVTGTDGKTSVCHLLGQALNRNNKNCGVLGTLGWGFGGEMQFTGLTTPDAIAVQCALASMRDRGARTVAMEVSSHALSQYRVSGVVFDVAVLTNIGRDHLDYHGDMQSYRRAKQQLFQTPQLRAAIINADDELGAQLLEQLPHVEVFTYGASERGDSHIRYANIEHLAAGLRFDLEFAGSCYPVKTALLGAFNVQNIAATFSVLVAIGVSPELAAESLADLKPVPGRMESTLLANGAVVIVDYAHNPHALESVLETLAGHCTGKLTVVFGCGGDRDQGKRPLMAEIAERYCDLCVVTDDNPRSESGDAIVEQIVAGFRSKDTVHIERDRRSAINYAMSKAESGDFVVVAGKGHEDYQLVGNKRLDFSDSAVVAEFAEASL